jgi:hypothetical protein
MRKLYPLFTITLFCSFLIPTFSFAQDHSDSLLAQLNQETQPASKHDYTTTAFKGTRIANGQSIKNVGAGVLTFRVSHRFGALNQGVRNFFGLDNAVTKIAFDYGITDWLTVGVGRGTYEKEYDGFAKVRILRQTTDNAMPLSMSYVGAVYAQSLPMPDIDGKPYPFSNRLSYMNQLLLARKFNRYISIQLMPTHIHYNIVPTTVEPNDIFALGIGGRVKLSNHIALTGEYYYLLPDHSLKGYHNSLSVGIDIETGGHVFQLLFTNSTAINERAVIGQTSGQWSNGDVHFGFNISRVFTIGRPKEFKKSGKGNW